MEHGYEATSLRAITAAADVNLAAVNHHFGSKEEALPVGADAAPRPDEPAPARASDAVRSRAAPKPLSCDRILSALPIPALKLARDPKRGGSTLRLLGRAYADSAPFIRQFLSEQYAVVIARFKAAFARALPNMPRKELSWRLHFIMGALSYTLAGTDALKLIAELNPHETTNDELCCRLGPFLLAGLTAPLLRPPRRDARAGRRTGRRHRQRTRRTRHGDAMNPFMTAPLRDRHRGDPGGTVRGAALFVAR